MSIGNIALRGVSWTALGTVVRGVVQFTRLIIAARILEAAELGALALVNLVIGLAFIIGDGGFASAFIYYRDLSQSRKNQLYTLSILIAAVLSLVLFSTSSIIESFFNIPGSGLLLAWIAPIFIFRSLSQLPIASLQKELKFKDIAKIEIVSSCSGLALMFVLLHFDYRALAIVWSQLFAVLMLFITMLFVGRKHLFSLSLIHFEQILEPLKYGLYQTGDALVNYLSSQFDQLLIGKVLGAEVLGFYAYIKDLVFRPALQLINPIVNRVTFPLMASIGKSQEKAKVYAGVLEILSLINIPLYLFMAFYSELILTIVYGQEWAQHGTLMSLMSIYMMLISLVNPSGALMRATGEVKRAFWWNIFVTVVRPGVIIASISGGIEAVVASLVALQTLLFVLHVKYLIKPVVNLRYISVFAPILLPAFAAISSIAMTHYGLNYGGNIGDEILALVTALAYIIIVAPFSVKKLKTILRK